NGRGQKVEVSLLESSLSMLANVASNHLVTGRDARRFGNGHPNIVPYTSYQASDGMIALAVGNDGQFAKFAEVVGRPEWARDPKFTRNSERITNRDELDAAITGILKTRTREDWVTRLRGAGVPCGRINTVGEALADDQATARDMVVEVDHPSAGTVKLLGIPFKMKGTPASVRRAPPRLGEHTDEVLAELGLDAARIAALRSAKIV
ncbi:MAG: CoA transferase, partial [Burkholderiales bacterium]